MKLTPYLLLATSLLTCAGRADSPVGVAIVPATAGPAIPPDFLGLSFGSKTLPPDGTGVHFFCATNRPLITLFRNLGIRHLRLGGTSVESPPSTPIPNEADIDDLFAFVKAAGVQKVIYSLRLLETHPGCNYAATNAAIAKYIWSKYRPWLDCLAIGNEPSRRAIYDQDPAIKNFDSYLGKWRQFASAITSAVPEATFAGPDASSGDVFWTTNFARAEKDAGLVQIVTEHFYPGGGGRDVPPAKSIEAMLSADWVTRNQRHYDRMAVPVMAEGFRYRFTEANDHFQGGTPAASDTFAGALWALDFLHWWAAHGASGVNFHNTQWVANDVITVDSNHRLTLNPKGYGLKAFALGSLGHVESVTILNPQGLNLAAYAVGDAGKHFVTLINKEHGPGARAASVTLTAPGPAKGAALMRLAARDGNAAAKTGVTLGGASIGADGPWLGKWEPLAVGQSGQCAVKVPAVSAAVVRIEAQ